MSLATVATVALITAIAPWTVPHGPAVSTAEAELQIPPSLTIGTMRAEYLSATDGHETLQIGWTWTETSAVGPLEFTYVGPASFPKQGGEETYGLGAGTAFKVKITRTAAGVTGYALVGRYWHYLRALAFPAGAPVTIDLGSKTFAHWGRS